ncbi:hypothetical protein PTMSG1_05252 [Pyrenophora teres f. maculata]|nr:hypothetical protein PTMSG1_05252 [Pyrenophora teres f. maculata]
MVIERSKSATSLSDLGVCDGAGFEGGEAGDKKVNGHAGRKLVEKRGCGRNAEDDVLRTDVSLQDVTLMEGGRRVHEFEENGENDSGADAGGWVSKEFFECDAVDRQWGELVFD